MDVLRRLLPLILFVALVIAAAALSSEFGSAGPRDPDAARCAEARTLWKRADDRAAITLGDPEYAGARIVRHQAALLIDQHC